MVGKRNCQGVLYLGHRGECLQFKYPRWETGYIRTSACKILLNAACKVQCCSSLEADPQQLVSVIAQLSLSLAAVEPGHFTAAAADLPQGESMGGRAAYPRMALAFISCLAARNHSSRALLGNIVGAALCSLDLVLPCILRWTRWQRPR